MTTTLRDLLDDGKVHVLDGAMGTMLYSKGFFLNVCYDELNLKQPKLVQEVHEAYVRAGAYIGLVHFLDELRLLQVELVVAHVEEEALGVQHRPHGSIQNVDFAVVEKIAERGRHSCSVIRRPEKQGPFGRAVAKRAGVLATCLTWLQ